VPFTIDVNAARKQMNLDISKPQEKAPDPLPEGWLGTQSRGIPVREIPHYDFPCVVYLHPRVPTRTVVHRNDRHEAIHEEEVPLEHLTKVICCAAHVNGGTKQCADCNKALEAALAEGWVREPYIPAPPPRPDVDLYGPRKKQGERK
jgi:hypothetical protein